MFHARNHPLTHYTLRSLFLSLSITHNNTSHSYTFSRTNTSIAFCFSSYVSAAVFLSLLSSFFFLFFFPITIYSVFFLIALLLLFFFLTWHYVLLLNTRIFSVSFFFNVGCVTWIWISWSWKKKHSNFDKRIALLEITAASSDLIGHYTQTLH